jgi:hypothetical protein
MPKDSIRVNRKLSLKVMQRYRHDLSVYFAVAVIRPAARSWQYEEIVLHDDAAIIN